MKNIAMNKFMNHDILKQQLMTAKTTNVSKIFLSELFYFDSISRHFINIFDPRFLDTCCEPNFVRFVALNSHSGDFNPYENLRLHSFYAIELPP